MDQHFSASKNCSGKAAWKIDGKLNWWKRNSRWSKSTSRKHDECEFDSRGTTSRYVLKCTIHALRIVHSHQMFCRELFPGCWWNFPCDWWAESFETLCYQKTTENCSKVQRDFTWNANIFVKKIWTILYRYHSSWATGANFNKKSTSDTFTSNLILSNSGWTWRRCCFDWLQLFWKWNTSQSGDVCIKIVPATCRKNEMKDSDS